YKTAIFYKAAGEQQVAPELPHHFWPGGGAVVFAFLPGIFIHFISDVFEGAQVTVKTGIHVNDIITLHCIDKYAQVKTVVFKVIGKAKSVVRVYISDNHPVSSRNRSGIIIKIA